MTKPDCWTVGDTLSDAARMSVPDRVRLIEALTLSLPPHVRHDELGLVRQLLEAPKEPTPKSIAHAGYHRMAKQMPDWQPWLFTILAALGAALGLGWFLAWWLK